jgi:hypothetical protein
MKKTIILMLLGILCNMSMRAADYQYLVFSLNDGTTKAITATDLTFTFTNDNLVATTSGGETLATLPLTQLAYMEFSTDGTSDINQINVNQIITDANTVIYDMQGRQMPQGSSLPKGVYIVKNSNRTIKVNIK